MAGSILGTLLLNIVAKADTNGLNKTNTALKKVSRTAQSTGKNIGFLSRLSGSLMGGFNFSVISNAFRNYLQFEKDLGAMKSRFFAITKDEKQATEEFDYIRDVALRTAQDVKSTADSYSIFYSSARRALGKEGAREVFESWTEVGRVLHMNEQQFERVTYALREMSSKGTLYSQDLKMQLGTHVPDAINIATTAIQNMGIKGVDTIEKFQKLTKNNPKSGYMAKFLIEFSKEAKSRFATPEALAKALQQPDALAQAIKNTGFVFLEQFSKRGGGQLLATILIGIQENIKKFPMEKVTAFLGEVANVLSKIFGVIFEYLPQIVLVLRDIVAAVTLFTVIGKIWKTFVWFDTLGGFSKSGGAFKAFGFKSVLKWAIKSSFSKILLSTAFKGVLAGAVNVVPVIGQILSILLTIWTVVDIIKALMPKKEKGDFTWQSSFGNLSGQQVQNIMRAVEKHGVINQRDLDRQLLNYAGGERLIGSVHYEDNKHVELTFNDSTVGTEDVLDLYNQISQKDDISEKKKKAGSKFNVGHEVGKW